jgi:23S rRNA pseudouridine2605 synthase
MERAMEERLQKILARAGLGSRRTCEELIRQGRVTVDGQTAQLGQKADPERERIIVDGKPIQLEHHHIYIALHKPAGVVCTTRDPQGRPTVVDLVPARPGVRLWPVGRLDLNSEGLILLTNDGELAHRLTHPRYEHTKEYEVCVEGHPDGVTLERWREGVLLDGRRTAPAQVELLPRKGNRTWLQVVLREGRKREIRRVAALLGYPVHRLIRVRIGPVRLGDLKPGEWRYLTRQELEQIEKIKDQGT